MMHEELEAHIKQNVSAEPLHTSTLVPLSDSKHMYSSKLTRLSTSHMDTDRKALQDYSKPSQPSSTSAFILYNKRRRMNSA